jgi:hypothetical protein
MPLIAALAAAIVLFAAVPSSAAPVVTKGKCTYPGGNWRLSVDQFDATRLRVIFVIRSGEPGSVWQLFGSDNQHPFITRTRTADLNGVVRARWRPQDRVGVDLIEAAGSGSNGASCSGSASF